MLSIVAITSECSLKSVHAQVSLPQEMTLASCLLPPHETYKPLRFLGNEKDLEYLDRFSLASSSVILNLLQFTIKFRGCEGR